MMEFNRALVVALFMYVDDRQSFTDDNLDDNICCGEDCLLRCSRGNRKRSVCCCYLTHTAGAKAMEMR